MTLATTVQHDPAPAGFLSGGGEMGERMRSHNWTGSPLGAPGGWPQPLKTLVGVMLGSNQAMFVAWGPARTMLYNDAYSEMLAAKHPAALGCDLLEVWHEISADLLPIVEQTYAGEPVNMDHIELVMERRGYREETHFSFFYAPVRDEAGEIGGLYCALNEITAQVRGRRQRREAEAALRAERDRTRRVLDGMTEGFGLLDREFRLIDMNAEGLRLEGRPLEEIIGKTHWEAWPGTEESDLGRLYKHAMEQRVPVSLDHRYVWPDGHAAWIETRAYPTDDGLALFWRDVTDRKLAEERLRETEAQFRLMADAVPQIVWITDAEGRAEFFNKQWWDYTGASDRPTTAAEVATDHIHPEDAAATMTAFNQARHAGTTFIVEHRIRSKAGEYRWFLVRGEPYRDEGGTVIRWFGASVDIHDRKLAEAALQELNETLAEQVAARSAERDQLWNLSQDLLARADYSGMIQAVSPAWTQVLGWSETELLSKPYTTFMHEDEIPATLEAIRGMAETREPGRYENRMATSDGGWKHIEWTVAPEPDGENFIAVGRDLTLARAREAELEVAQEALRQSQKVEAMGNLTGGVAHDFNNLLTPIIGSLDMLVRRGVGSERERRLIDGALQSAERAKTLVQRLLAFARRQPLQPSAVDAARLVDSMTDLIASTVGPTINVRVDLETDLPAALADENQLEMALLNLAVNARDAMPGGGELILSARRMSLPAPGRPGLKPADYICLAVSDTGAGMDAETLARAVEPFFSTKGIGKGTGLGLSMVDGLAAQLGGGLFIDSAPGKGTTVELCLPMSAKAVKDEADAAGDGEQVPACRGTALLVDDEELVRMSTADMLGDLGFEVVETGSAQEALQLMKNGEMPDLLVTDHLMPGMSGAELAREARVLKPGLPILIVSGYAEVEGIAPDLPRLTKPFRNADLAASLAVLFPDAPAR